MSQFHSGETRSFPVVRPLAVALRVKLLSDGTLAEAGAMDQDVGTIIETGPLGFQHRAQLYICDPLQPWRGPCVPTRTRIDPLLTQSIQWRNARSPARMVCVDAVTPGQAIYAEEAGEVTTKNQGYLVGFALSSCPVATLFVRGKLFGNFILVERHG